MLYTPCDIIRLQKNSRRLRELRRLNLKPSESEPTLSAVDFDADRKHCQQHGRYHPKTDLPRLRHQMIIDEKPKEKADDSDGKIHPLLSQEEIRVIIIRPRDDKTGTKDIHRPDDDQHDRHADDGLIVADPKAPRSLIRFPRFRHGSRSSSDFRSAFDGFV